MERKVMGKLLKTSLRLVLMTVTAALSVCGLSGCIEDANGSDNTVRSLFRIQETLTDTQARWIIVGETLLLVFLLLLTILLIALFHRYRKTEKRAHEAIIRERALMSENEALDRLNRMKTEFFQDMSHDFKTPLTVISTSVLNAVDMLDFEMDKDEMRESLNLAQSEIMRMSRLVEGALKQAALQGSQHGAGPIDIAPILRKVSGTYHAFLERHGNKLIVSVPGTLPHVYGSVDMLLNVLANLISNANRYTRNGEIEMSADVEDPFVCITVRDTGTGVKPEIMANIFTRGTSENGSGLGLTISKTAIETYGGTITIDSEEDVGTTVKFTMPIYENGKSDTEENIEIDE